MLSVRSKMEALLREGVKDGRWVRVRDRPPTHTWYASSHSNVKDGGSLRRRNHVDEGLVRGDSCFSAFRFGGGFGFDIEFKFLLLRHLVLELEFFSDALTLPLI